MLKYDWRPTLEMLHQGLDPETLEEALPRIIGEIENLSEQIDSLEQKLKKLQEPK